jgi:hypothetical protein
MHEQVIGRVEGGVEWSGVLNERRWSGMVVEHV